MTKILKVRCPVTIDGGDELRALVDKAIPGVKRAVIKKAIETRTGIVALGANGKPKKISYKRLMAE